MRGSELTMELERYKTVATSDYLAKLHEIAESTPCVKWKGQKSIAVINCFEHHLAKKEELAFEIECCLNGNSINSGLPENELFEMLVRLERLRQAHACKAQIFARNLGNNWKYI